MASNMLEDIDYENSSDEDDQDFKSSDEEDDAENVKLKALLGPREPTKKEKADDFEKEMDTALEKLVEKQAETYSGYLSKKTDDQPNRSKKIDQEDEEDTDSEAEIETGVRTTRKRPQFTNDELFYDPDQDELDQEWMNKQRATCKNKKNRSQDSKIKSNIQAQTGDSAKPAGPSDSRTDAILNCPGCMTLLCHDCQRHERYRTQYRAMFVFNCRIRQDEQLKYPNEKGRKQKQIANGDGEVYNPVECANCKTEVGVYDPRDELYHFFNTLASHA